MENTAYCYSSSVVTGTRAERGKKSSLTTFLKVGRSFGRMQKAHFAYFTI